LDLAEKEEQIERKKIIEDFFRNDSWRKNLVDQVLPGDHAHSGCWENDRV